MADQPFIARSFRSRRSRTTKFGERGENETAEKRREPERSRHFAFCAAVFLPTTYPRIWVMPALLRPQWLGLEQRQDEELRAPLLERLGELWDSDMYVTYMYGPRVPASTWGEVSGAMPGHDSGHEPARTGAKARKATQKHPRSKARRAEGMQRNATGRKGSDRTAKPLFAGSIPARASL
jgi:hypothetical protein